MKIFKILLFCLFLTGCLTAHQRPSKVILLPEERIFTLPAGQEINVLLDKKPIAITFPEDMKIVSPTTLVRQEVRLADAMLKKVKADSEKKKLIGIFGSILAILAAALGIFFKAKSWFPKKITTTIEGK